MSTGDITHEPRRRVARSGKRATAQRKPRARSPVAPQRVAILGLGPSVGEYLNLVKRHGGRKKFYDEVWAINALGDVLVCDRIFHMDDVRIQQIRAKAKPESNIATMLAWMKTHPGPIITSRAHPGYPGLVEFPLEDIINSIGVAYFNNTAACAVAYAIHIGVKHLAVYGNDFTYPNAHHAEKGRACVEFLLGIATARGIQISLPKTTSLMDACEPQAERLYGYDTVNVHLDPAAGGRVKLRFTEREKLPSAEEIEKRYDHSKHPSPLVSGANAKEQ